MRMTGPVFPVTDPPEWVGATWVGEVVVDESPDEGQEHGGVVRLEAAQGFARARIIVRDATRVHGFLTIAVDDGGVDAEQLRAAIAALPAAPQELPSIMGGQARPFSVVLCTRERPDDLRVALASVLRQDYAPGFEVVVVDNAPVTSATKDAVAALGDDRVRVVTEATPGLSHARNAGLAATRHEWVAFTDDDVVADRWWLRGLARGFTRGGADVACVTGLVPTGELRTAPQSWFDQRIGWGTALGPRAYSLRNPPADLPYFPFQVGRYGTGANFATLRETAIGIGFDPYLGAGTPSKGGEDLDYFFRVIARGGTLVYEPSSFVWHRHRDTRQALESQAVGYGRGLTAWATKLVLSPVDLAHGLRALLRRESLTLAPFRAYTDPAGAAAQEDEPSDVAEIMAIERRALRSGPWSYVGPRFFGR